MSLVTNSLRSHFFKHLLCSTTATYFSGHHIRRRLIWPTPISFLYSARQPLTTRTATFSTISSSSLETLAAGSFTSPYLSVDIHCPKNVADMLSEALLCFGGSSTIMDEIDNTEVDDEICMRCIFSVGQDVKECILHAADSIGLKDIPSYNVVMHDHTDWIKETQESFHPVEVTQGLWIVPEWRKPPDLQATSIVLNPGLAFGTGEHPTTKLCLLLLHDSIKGGEFFLDYGTGSGILAIAAVKFGAAFAVGLDIDPQAIAAARHNAALNEIQPEKLFLNVVSSENSSALMDENSAGDKDRHHHLYDTRVLKEVEKFDIVIANILLNPLLDLADKIVSYAKPGATVGLSGIISEQVSPCCVANYRRNITTTTWRKFAISQLSEKFHIS